jgi:hypothetical protein
MNDEHAYAILSRLHVRLNGLEKTVPSVMKTTRLEAYNHPLAISDLNAVIHTYHNLKQRGAPWMMNDAISQRAIGGRNSMEIIDGGYEFPYDRIETGGRDFIDVRGTREYSERDAEILFDGKYRVDVRNNRSRNTRFMRGPSFDTPVEVFNYLNERVFPMGRGHINWEQPVSNGYRGF